MTETKSLVELVSRFIPGLKKNGNEFEGHCAFCESEPETATLKVGEVSWRALCCGQHEINGADAIGFYMSWAQCTREEATYKLGNGSLPEPFAVQVPALKRLPFFGWQELAKEPDWRVWIHDSGAAVEAARELVPSRVHLGLIAGRDWQLDILKGRQVILVPRNEEGSIATMARLADCLYDAGHETVRWIDPRGMEEYWTLADAKADGWDSKQTLTWASKHSLVYSHEAPQASPSVALADSNSEFAAGPAVASPIQGDTQVAAPPEIVQQRKPTLAVVEKTGALLALRKPDPDPLPDPDQLPAFSEFALAQVFADGPGTDWRNTAAWELWAKWDGLRWVPDERRLITWEIKDCCKAAMAEHLADSTPAQRMKVAAMRTVNAVRDLARSDPRIATGVSEWDADPYLLGTPAGVIDLRTGATVPAEKGQLISKSVSVGPVPGAHPWWNRVISRPAGGAIAGFLKLWCGYILTGDTREERFLFVHGPGGGGKSKFLGVVSEILGDYRRTAPMDAFTVRQHHEHSEEIARLAGARLVVAAETEEGSRWNEARIKQLTGRDLITARHMRMSSFEFPPQFKLVFIGNHRPALRSVGEEMRRRIDLIDWGGTIPEAERVLDLPDKLRAEYPAILAWMIEGCLEWQRVGLGKPAEVSASVADYLQGEDTLGAWLEDCVELSQGSRTKTGDAYHNFKRWAEGVGEFVPSQKRFTQRLKERGFAVVKSGTARFQDMQLKVTETEARVTSGWVPD